MKEPALTMGCKAFKDMSVTLNKFKIKGSISLLKDSPGQNKFFHSMKQNAKIIKTLYVIFPKLFPHKKQPDIFTL